MAGNTLKNVIIPSIDETKRWDITITNGQIHSRVASSSSSSSLSSLPPPSLLLPPLCHPHIHLDKPYLLTSNQASSASHPDYSDLLPKTGDFQEALANTSAAKARFTYDDLYLRGSQLLAESYGHGVTAMRVFVEVDHVVKLTNLQAAVQLKNDFGHLIRVQICAFAQDPLFSTEEGATNLQYMQEALETFAGEIEALGTTPYVEKAWDGLAEDANQRKNIDWAVATSLRHGLHLDFHLDYDLDPSHPGMLSSVLGTVHQKWAESANSGRTVVIGHCTHLTTYTHQELEECASLIKQYNTPVHFVGLPTSDLYMMGRSPARKVSSSSDATTEPSGCKPHGRPRGTLQVPAMIKDYHFDACLGVNNVGNAFTPYGSGDPLQLACWGTGIYHAGTVADANLLYGCVSDRARRAIGLDQSCATLGSGHPAPSQDQRANHDGSVHMVPLPGLLIQNRTCIALPGNGLDPDLHVPARQRLSIKDVVWDPPETGLRRIIR